MPGIKGDKGHQGSPGLMGPMVRIVLINGVSILIVRVSIVSGTKRTHGSARVTRRTWIERLDL